MENAAYGGADGLHWLRIEPTEDKTCKASGEYTL
jgi:hypothetical protein